MRHDQRGKLNFAHEIAQTRGVDLRILQLVGFFLPGDSLPVTAGFPAAITDVLTICPVLTALSVAAIIGDSTGYAIGTEAGAALYNRPPSRIFNRHTSAGDEVFLRRIRGHDDRSGAVYAVGEDLCPDRCGYCCDELPEIHHVNLLGGIGWVVSMTLLGYLFGQIPFVTQHIEKALILIIFLSVAPVVLHAWKSKRLRARSRVVPSP